MIVESSVTRPAGGSCRCERFLLQPLLNQVTTTPFTPDRAPLYLAVTDRLGFNQDWFFDQQWWKTSGRPVLTHFPAQCSNDRLNSVSKFHSSSHMLEGGVSVDIRTYQFIGQYTQISCNHTFKCLTNSCEEDLWQRPDIYQWTLSFKMTSVHWNSKLYWVKNGFEMNAERFDLW